MPLISLHVVFWILRGRENLANRQYDYMSQCTGKLSAHLSVACNLMIPSESHTIGVWVQFDDSVADEMLAGGLPVHC